MVEESSTVQLKPEPLWWRSCVSAALPPASLAVKRHDYRAIREGRGGRGNILAVYMLVKQSKTTTSLS
jgi:hypothetical protein